MSDFLEDRLREALQSGPAPAGFAERVMNRIPERRHTPRAFWYAAAAAALIVALLFAGFEQRRERELAKERKTEQQLVFALSLTIQKLEHVNERLQRSATTVRVEEKRGQRL